MILEEESCMADPVKAIVVVVAILIALFFGFCCHFASQKRRDEEQNRGAVQGRGTSGNTNQNNASTVYIIGLQDQGATSNSNTRAPNENGSQPTSPQSPDPIADSGPPPYSCLTTAGEPLPPPSYEEALGASTEHLAVTQQQHIV